MTFEEGASEPGFTFENWLHDTTLNVIYVSEPNVSVVATISVNQYCFDAVSFIVKCFQSDIVDNCNPPGGGTWKVWSNQHDPINFQVMSSPQTIQLDWTDIQWLKVQLEDPGVGNPNNTFDFDSLIYEIPTKTVSDMPILTFESDTICPEEITNLLIDGGLNDASDWAIFTDGCTGSNMIGMTSSNSFEISPTANTKYYVKGIDVKGCVDDGPCAESTLIQVASISTELELVTGIPNPAESGALVMLHASGGISGTGATIKWYSEMNGLGDLLGSGSMLEVQPIRSKTYYTRREGKCNETIDYKIRICLNHLDITDAILANDPHEATFRAESLSASGIVTSANSEALQFIFSDSLNLISPFEVEKGAILDVFPDECTEIDN